MQYISSLFRKQKPRTPVVQPTPVLTEAGTSSAANKIVFLGNENHYSFDLEDLLKASAEVLGKGSNGTSYKAVLEEGTTVVVKRLKDVVLSQSKLVMQMDVLGTIRHDNLAPFRAYYFSKDEKMLISDYFACGSLSSRLHGNGSSSLDWESRKKIALSTAEGISHLHITGKLVHGNIKSANIFLGLDHHVSLFDFGLNVLFESGTPPKRIEGYCAPEILETRKVTYQSDVYSFGVLLLELLTGKAPNRASLVDEGMDLPRWVHSVVREEWTNEVFDMELMSTTTTLGKIEMLSLVEIAMLCVSCEPEQRPNIQEVVRLIEDLSRGETGDGLRHSNDVTLKAMEAGNSSSIDDINVNKLVYFGNNTNSIDLEDLLGSSNDVLGVGSIGMSFKTGSKDGTTVVVKRLNNVDATKSEFDSQMRVLENIKHDNVVSLKAYYFSDDEKLLVSDYMLSGSLSSTLHGGLDTGQASLDWENRKKIALNTTKGIAHLHISGKLVHGNIKSSNLLLSPDHHVSLSDFGLNTLFGSAPPPNRDAGYSAPEILETKKVTFQSDIYSLGMLLLELLTGKAPNQASLGEGTINLPSWVRSVGREEWTTMVFDAELTRDSNIEGEMVSLLQIAMACVSNMPDQRPEIQEVVCLIENLIILNG